jgi:hypothetical protein
VKGCMRTTHKPMLASLRPRLSDAWRCVSFYDNGYVAVEYVDDPAERVGICTYHEAKCDI